ncbi:hypothetical protein [Pseudomonas sp. Marseille-Q1929]|uniref:hypothetical protein n=1 Tax=Pseudomonas sp. Marseille-Q1929 TaxID=2730402 RepID=UPI001A8C6284|nr:hypothetical protein [Pseudomonas sp. Marseille-Q1929]MBO0496209.1 hypothetical protein [Pseudomonas sp. Marseille-Q1929]
MSTNLMFKLYGDFHWPPSPTVAASPTRKRGCVEIYYTKLKSGQYGAYLVWVPREVSGESLSEISDDSPSVFTLDSPDDWFASTSNANKPIWVERAEDPQKEVVLCFRGAYLFEQYSQTSPKNNPELRWPLVPEYGTGKNTVFSTLTINRSDGLPSTLKFELALPLAVNHSNANSWAAFPISAVYSSKVGLASQIGRLYAFYGRGFKNGKIVEYPIGTAAAQRLGEFDLASERKSKTSCLYFPEEPEDPKVPKDPRFYWNAGNKLAGSLLASAGLSPSFEGESSAPYGYLHLANSALDDNERFTLGYRAKASTLTLGTIDDVEGVVKLSGPVHIHIALEWQITSKDLWTPESWLPKLSFRLIWTSPVNKKDFASAPDPKLPFARRLLVDTFKQAASTQKNLPLIEGLQPLSFLPDFSVSKDSKVAFVLCSQRLLASCAQYHQDRQHYPFISWQSALPARLKLTLAKPNLMSADESPEVDESTKNSLPLTATLNGFSNTALTLTLSGDEQWAQQEADSKDAGSPYFASFALKVESVDNDTEGRIGSLLLDVPAYVAKKDKDDLGFLRTAGRALGGRHARRYNANGQLNASLSLTLPVSRVTPIATDVARTDRSGRPAPLLISLEPNEPTNSAATINYFLKATETFGTDEDRLLTVALLDKSQAQGARDYLLLSEQPYSILRFRQTLLGARGSAASAEVAIYSSDDRLWQYRNTTPLYHFMLPPQAFGESADKPRRMELHDRDVLPANGAPPTPYPENVEPRGDVLLRHAVQFRLTPSTDLWIQPSDVTRGYFIPEQASYELFRQRGEYGLGAAVAGLRSEFLYGLSVGVDVNSERSVSRFTRVAEISALTGDIVGSASKPRSDQDIAKRWNKLSAVIASRPERLELWARDPSSPVDFAPARFAEGTRFALRNTALHSPPLVDLDTPAALPGLEPGALRFHESGLRGGALWPIESLNLLNTLRAFPESRGGTLEQVALAPFGGDAAQKAEFLNGNVKVISETRNGYVERHKIEVMGRIGAFWHRAKHVVVFERTVNPSAQFAPAHDENPQTRSRRPVLRKVSEYIELLQPERLYPDFPQAQARSSGFLDRVRFNSRIINVDSAWGSDVGDFGWQIPLWNRGAAKERPQVYSMPDIAFVTVAEGDGENALVAQECQDPDLLYFFAEFNARVNDTDVWQSRVGIDYANLPSAQTISKAVEPKTAHDTDARRPAVSRILPGARRFTWRLAPAASKTAINAGRAQTPIYVGVESVSFMRAGLAQQAQQRFEPLAAIAKAALKTAPPGNIGFWGGDEVPAVLPGEEVGTLAELIKKVQGSTDLEQAKLGCAELTSFWAGQELASKLGVALSGQAQQLAAAVGDTNLRGLLSGVELPADIPNCQKLQAKAIAQVRSKSMLVRTMLHDRRTKLDKLVDGLTATTKNEVITNLASGIEASLNPLFKEASKDVGDIRAGTEKARGILLALSADVETTFSRALTRLDQLQASYDRNKPWSVERRRAFQADCQAAVSNVRGDIAGAIDEARQRLSIELGDFCQVVASEMGRRLALFAMPEATVFTSLTSLNEFVGKELGSFSASLNLARSELFDRLEKQIGAAKEAVEKSQLGKQPGADQNTEQALKNDLIKCLDGFTAMVIAAGVSVTDQTNAAKDLQASVQEKGFENVLARVLSLGTDCRTILESLRSANSQLNTQSQKLLDSQYGALKQTLASCWSIVSTPVEDLEGSMGRLLEVQTLDRFVQSSTESMRALSRGVLNELHGFDTTLNQAAGDLSESFGALQNLLNPEALLHTVVMEGVVIPALTESLALLPETLTAVPRAEIKRAIAQLADDVGQRLDRLDINAAGYLGDISALCGQFSGGLKQVEDRLLKLAGQQTDYFKGLLAEAKSDFEKAYGSAGATIEDIVKAVKAFDRGVRELQNDLSRTAEDAQRYGDRLLATAGSLLGGNLMATPSNVLKLYSAVTSAPELAGLKSDIERIRANFDELSDVIDTTEATALLNRMGDELKALGLSFPYDKISNRLLPASLQGMDLGKLFGNIGGANLGKLFKGEKLSDSLRDAIRLTHDFDRQQARAWVQVDIDAPMPGRHTLFAIGPFQCDFVDMRIVGQVRIDASKDSDEVSQSGYGRLGATLDMLVSGQSMVRFEKFALNFSREHGLKVDFDPNNIRLNPAFQFVQDALLGLFPDAVGPMTVIKNNGIPIGVEHEYAMPVISANAGTSGISNLSIENRFRLIAHPDFILADRFSLSRPERPFIFSLFILGGTGFVQIETEYRPFDAQLSVTVDAAAGASALLGFSCGPFSGQVFITLSAVLTYRKMIGQSGGGLSVSALLVIAGNVDVMGIATVSIYVTLRLAYRDNGQVDADGSLSVTIKISRFFSIRARANVRYRLREGRAQTQVSADLDVDVESDSKIKEAAEKAITDAKKLQGMMV